MFGPLKQSLGPKTASIAITKHVLRDLSYVNARRSGQNERAEIWRGDGRLTLPAAARGTPSPQGAPRPPKICHGVIFMDY